MKVQEHKGMCRYLDNNGLQIAFVKSPRVIFNRDCLTASGVNQWGLPVVNSYVDLAKPEYRAAIAKIESLHPRHSLTEDHNAAELSKFLDEVWGTDGIQEIEC